MNTHQTAEKIYFSFQEEKTKNTKFFFLLQK